METFAVSVRWVHFVGASLVVGVFAFLAGVARPAARAAGADAQAAFEALDRRLVAIGAWALGATLASGLLDLWRQVAVATGLDLGASLIPAAFASVLSQTRYGTVWLVRHALLTLLGALLLLRDQERGPADWFALRLEGIGLAAASLAIIGAAGHAASAQRAPEAAIAVDAVHLLATGIWFGGLIPLVLFLRWALALPDAAGARVAAVGARRFSAIGLAGVGLLTVTGAYNLWEQVASVPAFFGTPYGRWLSVKLTLLLLLLVVAALNLLVLKPRLARAAAESGADHRRIIRRLQTHAAAEVALGCVILGVVAVVGLATPARHMQPSWPFSFRFAWEVTKDLPGVRTRVAIGSQVAMFGLIAALCAALVQIRRWRWIAGAGAAAVVLGLGLALPPLAFDAYPTTYLRPRIPYTATSIARGLALYREHCATCHGVAGYGDGPAGAGLPRKPADLTAKHTGDHTVGDLFWWLTHGIRGSPMPGFGDRLSTEDRWDLINFLRTLSAAEQARRLGAVAIPVPALVAPDFAFTTGVGEDQALKDYRGRSIVVLVFLSLPESTGRLLQLSSVYSNLRRLGAEVLGIPLRASGDIYRALGPRPIVFPIVVDGAAEAATTYALFRRDFSATGQLPDPPMPAHMELLIDRQGYLRARWIPDGGGGWAELSRLLLEVERLAREIPRAAAPDEHVH